MAQERYPVTSSDESNTQTENLEIGRQGFFIFNNEMILSHLHTAVNFGPNLYSMISEINQLIADVDSAEGVTTGYTVSTADFSAYPTY